VGSEMCIRDSCFSNCEFLESIPSGLFDNCPDVTTFAYCFDACASITSAAPELWDRVPEPTGTNCYRLDEGLSNWDDIPETWGGPL